MAVNDTAAQQRGNMLRSFRDGLQVVKKADLKLSVVPALVHFLHTVANIAIFAKTPKK